MERTGNITRDRLLKSVVVVCVAGALAGWLAITVILLCEVMR